jgi:hypothetical protein
MNESLICIDLNPNVKPPLVEVKLSKHSKDSIKESRKASSNNGGYLISVKEIEENATKMYAN